MGTQPAVDIVADTCPELLQDLLRNLRIKGVGVGKLCLPAVLISHIQRIVGKLFPRKEHSIESILIHQFHPDR